MRSKNLTVRAIALALVYLLLSACANSPTSPAQNEQDTRVFGAQTDTIESLLESARASTGESSAISFLDAAQLMINSDSASQAITTLNEINNPEALSEPSQARMSLIRAEAALSQEKPQVALDSLEQVLENNSTLPIAILVQARQLRADSLAMSEQYVIAVRERIDLGPLLTASEQINNGNAIWELLSNTSETSLQRASVTADSYELRGWLELTRLMRTNQNSIHSQIKALDGWRKTWTQHSAATSPPDALTTLYTIWDKRPQVIALVIPVQEPLGKAILEGFLSAYYEALAQGQELPKIRIYDTSFSPEALVHYDQAVHEGVDFIIGPLQKSGVRRMQISRRPMPVPTLALNYGDLGGGAPTGLYQFGLAPEDEIIQSANTAWTAGHRNAAVLTPAGEDYQRIRDTFVEYWTSLGGRIVSVDNYANPRDYSPVIKRIFNIDRSESRAEALLTLLPRDNMEFVPRRRQDIDFIFLLANPNEGRQIKPTLSFHFAGEVPVYAMPGIYDGGSNLVANRDLNGIIFSDAPWVLGTQDPLKATVRETWSAATGPVQRLRAMGVDSFRVYLRLAQMQQYPFVTMKGATGTLKMSQDGRIHRSLENAIIENGEARLLAP
jgi:outer membrane PBP1 activator LpoA protein